MAWSSSKTGQDEKSLPGIVNQGYFSDYFLAYRLDAGLADLYKRWDDLERTGEPTSRSRLRGLGRAFDAYRVDASLTAPDAIDDPDELNLKMLPTDGISGLQNLNDAVLRALGWIPDRSESLTLISGDKVLHIPVALRCETPSGLLLVAIETVFATDPSTVLASKVAPAGRLLEPVLVGDKPVGRFALEAAQMIFTADEPPNYVLVCSGGALLLLDRDRWGEGVFLGANLDDAVARNDARARGELASIAALFCAEAIDPGDDAQSILTSLLNKAANESAGVSKELRHGVRRSVELLANAVVRDVRFRQKGAWAQIDPEQLTRECLRYLYRIIVLLFAEARPELGILPVDDVDYQAGYSLARLRDVALTELHGDHALNSRHIQQSLALLFNLVDEGHEPEASLGIDTRWLSFPSLGSTLFAGSACPMLDRAHVSDHTLQQVLANLCFTQEQRGRSRQSLSYSALGINQLGAVYEGLMAYKGFLATEDLYEIDNDGDADNGSWVIPAKLADEYPDNVFLKETDSSGHEHRVIYREGDFVFRLSGRDRQRSASYYTPEVLTEFTVRHTLDVYFDEHPDITADEILELTICEPALGSGAFLAEAINQVAARYLKARQDELGETIDPDQYQLELQKAKAHFAINQSYGVDLNPTAVELAEVSLWLSCMHPGLSAPNFDARLRQGNSLIGVRRATYTIDQLKAQPWKSTSSKPALSPADQTLNKVPFGEVNGIHHFLVPGEGWGSASQVTDLKGKGGRSPTPGLAGEWAQSVSSWRRAVLGAPTTEQLARLTALAGRVESAWEAAAKDAENHLRSHSRAVGVWNADETQWSASSLANSDRFLDPERPAARLRLLMDAWCALWMWAPSNGTALPSFNEWLEAAELLLGQPSGIETGALFTSYELADGTLDSVENFGRATVSEVLDRFTWLVECKKIADRQAFFHWELDQASVFLRGGFDLQVGNPPWVRPRWSEEDALAEHDPYFGITKQIPEQTRQERKARVLARDQSLRGYVADLAENVGLNAILGSGSREPLLLGQQNNLYLLFMTNTWRRRSPHGVVALIHPEGFLSDPNATSLRETAYRRYRRHFHFINSLMLFAEISNTREYGIHIYADLRPEVGFLQATYLYHPSVADRSIGHDGSGDLPGRKQADGGWDLRPHVERLVWVDPERLVSWAALLNYEDQSSPPLVRTVTSAEATAADAIARYPVRLSGIPYFWTRGFDEQSAKRSGLVEERTEVPTAWNDVLFQGPHIGICNPYAKQPRPTGRNQQDYVSWDLTTLPDSAIPRTNWQRKASRETFEDSIERWDGIPLTERSRIIVRRQVPSNTFRSVFASLIPPGPTCMSVCYQGGLKDERLTAAFCGMLGGLLADFFARLSGVTDLHDNVISRFPAPDANSPLIEPIVHRVLRLNCLTSEFASLWESLVDPSWANDDFALPELATRSLADVSRLWSASVPIRSEGDRWLLLTELDALGALMVGVSSEGLAAVYNSQFPVLRNYESEMLFDRAGNQIAGDHHQFGQLQSLIEEGAREATPKGWIKVWDRVRDHHELGAEVDTSPFEPPFRLADRVAAMTAAYEVFKERYGLEVSEASVQ